MDCVDLGPKRVGSMSKGQRQRIGLAQAVLHRPKALFLDEPTSGLDPLASIVREISVGSNQQADGLRGVNAAVTRIDAMTRENAHLVEDWNKMGSTDTEKVGGTEDRDGVYNTGVKLNVQSTESGLGRHNSCCVEHCEIYARTTDMKSMT
ncbi:ATP-binding cassette domain-containing protein [Rhizobium leguminosarum]|uniref:ATP-binding cassette domain-containing protein n=2 Tax=Rhizobium leguminosarum TaxID=384 RepID=A0ACD5FFF5_RHILE